MSSRGNIAPLRDLVLVERLSGHGIERTSKGGIVLPSTLEAKAKTKADWFRARVLAVGPEARDVRAGEDVLVYTWKGETGRGLYTGHALGAGQLLIAAEDIVAALDPTAEVA